MNRYKCIMVLVALITVLFCSQCLAFEFEKSSLISNFVIGMDKKTAEIVAIQMVGIPLRMGKDSSEYQLPVGSSGLPVYEPMNGVYLTSTLTLRFKNDTLYAVDVKTTFISSIHKKYKGRCLATFYMRGKYFSEYVRALVSHSIPKKRFDEIMKEANPMEVLKLIGTWVYVGSGEMKDPFDENGAEIETVFFFALTTKYNQPSQPMYVSRFIFMTKSIIEDKGKSVKIEVSVIDRFTK